MSDWQIGDLAVCVKRDAWRGNRTGRIVEGPRYGAIHRVASVVTGDPGVGLELEGVPSRRNPSGSIIPWRADRFRKINDSNDDAELVERIKNCRPAKVGEPA